MVLRLSIPVHIKFPVFLKLLKKIPAETMTIIRATDVYNPEILFSISGVLADAEGRTRFLTLDGHSSVCFNSRGAE